MGRRIACLAGLALAAVAATPTAPALGASAGSELTFSATPLTRAPYFQLRIAAGASATGRLRLRNTSAHAITVLVRPNDLGTADTGGASFDPPTPGGAGSWVTVPARSVALRPRQSALVSFSVAVPRRTRAGEHYSGIVVYDSAQLASAGKSARGGGATRVLLRHVTRVGFPIRVTVPGPLRRGLSLARARFDANAAGALLRLPLRNSGNALIRNTTLSLQAAQGGRIVMTRKAQIRDFVPGVAIRLPLAWPGRPVPGRYDVTGVIRPAGARAIRINQTITFGKEQSSAFKRATGRSVSPKTDSSPLVWMILGVVILFAFAMTVAYVRMRRELKQPRP